MEKMHEIHICHSVEMDFHYLVATRNEASVCICRLLLEMNMYMLRGKLHCNPLHYHTFQSLSQEDFQYFMIIKKGWGLFTLIKSTV